MWPEFHPGQHGVFVFLGLFPLFCHHLPLLRFLEQAVALVHLLGQVPPCSEIVLVLVKLSTYMFRSIHNHVTKHIVWLVIWDVWNSSFVSQVLFSPDCQLINLSNVPRDSYMVFMVLGSWLILTIEQTIVHVITYTMKWCWHVLERTTIRLRINNQFRSTRSIHLEIVLNVGYLYLIICKDVLRHLQCDEMNEKFNYVVNNCQVVWRFVIWCYFENVVSVSRNETNQWRKTVIHHSLILMTYMIHPKYWAKKISCCLDYHLTL